MEHATSPVCLDCCLLCCDGEFSPVNEVIGGLGEGRVRNKFRVYWTHGASALCSLHGRVESFYFDIKLQMRVWLKRLIGSGRARIPAWYLRATWHERNETWQGMLLQYNNALARRRGVMWHWSWLFVFSLITSPFEPQRFFRRLRT